MSDSTLPESWTDARKIILANAPWCLLLVAIERAFEAHFIQALVAFIFCILSLGVAIHWKAFEGLTQPKGRWRLALGLVIAGLMFLAAGVYLLAAQQPSLQTDEAVNQLTKELHEATETLEAERKQRRQAQSLASGLREELMATRHTSLQAQPSVEETTDSGPIKWESVLWFPASPDGSVRFIMLRGENSSTSAVQISAASFTSAITGETKNLSISIPYGDVGGEKIPVQQANPIPAGAKIQLIFEWAPPLSVQEMMSKWGKTSFSINYGDFRFRKVFDAEFMKAALVRDIVGADLVLGVPHVTKKSQ
ncbi:hypothetical protein ACWAT4_10625 [Bradyrhizobium manausense]